MNKAHSLNALMTSTGGYVKGSRRFSCPISFCGYSGSGPRFEVRHEVIVWGNCFEVIPSRGMFYDCPWLWWNSRWTRQHGGRSFDLNNDIRIRQPHWDSECAIHVLLPQTYNIENLSMNKRGFIGLLIAFLITKDTQVPSHELIEILGKDLVTKFLV